jgi:hypothetical protein
LGTNFRDRECGIGNANTAADHVCIRTEKCCGSPEQIRDHYVEGQEGEKGKEKCSWSCFDIV